ncbi:iduronate 2-sulfatase-like [Littorina saxatilis]|uniref:Sulfatase N-terminal domain-containing protein n=1 Tax=Littorina saxatilis TaxID=31220 RepID=A0AAN9BC09_9CAEN
MESMKMFAVGLFSLIFVLLGHDATSASSASRRPNVLFLVVDDLRPRLGCYGQSVMVTPNIDRLAATSVRFDRAFVQQALCNPSRTSFLTSRRPDSTRIFDLWTYFRNISGNFTTLPQYFKDNGYVTQSVGKIFHPGSASGFTDDYPHSWTYPAFHGSTEKHMLGQVCPGADGQLHKYAVCPVANLTQVPGGSLPDIQSTDFAVQFLHNRSRQPDQPFFLAVGFHKPHQPLRYPAKYLDLYPMSKIRLAPNNVFPQWLPSVAWNPYFSLRQNEDVAALHVPWPFGPLPEDFQLKMRQSYSAATSYTDAQLGRVLEALDQAGFADNTVISFHGDHGWSLGEHEEWCKFSNFDITTRIPFMFHVPGVTSQKAPPGKTFPFIDAFTYAKDHPTTTEEDCANGKRQKPETCSRGNPEVGGLSTDAFAEAVDLFPTLAELAGLVVPPTCPENDADIPLCTQGSSLVPVIHNVTKKSPSPTLEWKKAVFSQYPRPAYYPQNTSDSPRLDAITIMGYTMRTDFHRYTEWLPYDTATFTADWDTVLARELYVHADDPLENWNMADVTSHGPLVTQLSTQLRAGWRNALPWTQ